LDFTWQPIDEIYSYFGSKVGYIGDYLTLTYLDKYLSLCFKFCFLLGLLQIATYFTFLGMYTRWLFFPAAFGLATQLFDFGYSIYPKKKRRKK
jgi:anoctamin-10